MQRDADQRPGMGRIAAGQGAAAHDWLAEREADLLPVNHVVFT